jgi:hypothetical protein
VGGESFEIRFRMTRDEYQSWAVRHRSPKALTARESYTYYYWVGASLVVGLASFGIMGLLEDLLHRKMPGWVFLATIVGCFLARIGRKTESEEQKVSHG